MSEPTQLDIKRVEILQGIITRMAQNSFTIKGWAVTVVTALLALSNKSSALYALYPAIAFWVLDAFYLMQERLFRDLSKRRASPGLELEFTTIPSASAFLGAAFSLSVFPLYVLSMALPIYLVFFS